MTPIFKKLNYKNQNRILLLNAPESFLPQVDDMSKVAEFDTTINSTINYEFILLFTEMQIHLMEGIEHIKNNFATDCLLWVAYPKKSSKKYKSDINRDSDCWQILGDLGFEGVRAVAIDEDWSAIRFRDADFIKKLTRNPNWIRSEKGKKKRN